MKIKTKKQLNLPQLIEWAWDNKIRNKTYRSSEGAEIEFREGDVVRVYLIESDDTFTVEVEEEITEDTVIPKTLTLYDDGDAYTGKNHSVSWYNKVGIKAIYLIDDDMTLTLIWRDGKLI